MSWTQSKDVSLIATRCFMKLMGFWVVENRKELRVQIAALSYTSIVLLIAIFVISMDTYYTWGEFNQCIYEICNVMTLSLLSCKVVILFIHRRKLNDLIQYTQKNFWHSNYDSYENSLLNKCKRTCTLLVCVFSFFAEGTAFNYAFVAIVANIGKSGVERVLPFPIWISVPSTLTPYFEILFTIEVVCLIHLGVCYLCVDNFLCVINLHVTYQFRILQYRFESINKIADKDKKNKSPNESAYSSSQYYAAFKDCVQQHQKLIAFCNSLEEIFTFIIFGQVLIFSLLICLDGYMIFMADASMLKRTIFIFHILGCMCQLVMFTYSCDCLIQESTKLASSVYSIKWQALPMTKDAKMLRKDLTFVMLRCGVPCCLTANRFFAVSLETCTTVLSTAVSYFTLLRDY